MHSHVNTRIKHASLGELIQLNVNFRNSLSLTLQLVQSVVGFTTGIGQCNFTKGKGVLPLWPERWVKSGLQTAKGKIVKSTLKW